MSGEKRKFECSALPKGWQREEVPRKTGLSAGKIDVYYYSPDGKKFRSKPQLARYLGNTLDLATFDFRTGKVNSLLMRKNKKQRGTQFDYRSSSSDCADIEQENEKVDRESKMTVSSSDKREPSTELSVTHSLQENSTVSGVVGSSENQYKVTVYCDSESGSVKTLTMLRSVAPKASPKNLTYYINSVHLDKNTGERPVCSFCRGIRNDASLVPPIRQTASIFKQPVTVYKMQEGKVKTDFKHGTQEKPKQLFWEKRLEGLRACDADGTEFNMMELPRVLKAVGPHVSEETVLQSVATALHVSTQPVTGQTGSRSALEKNSGVFLNPDQPLMQAVSVADDDIKRQEERVQAARKKLQDALKKSLVLAV